jgi:hypothetical protein
MPISCKEQIINEVAITEIYSQILWELVADPLRLAGHNV